MYIFTMPRITFFLRSNILYCRVSLKGTTAEFSTNEKLIPEYWNQKAQKYQIKSAQSRYVTTLIESLSYKLKSLAVLSVHHNAKSIILALKPKLESQNQIVVIRLSDILQNFIEFESRSKSENTIKHHYIKLKNLKLFEASQKTVFYINSEDPQENFDLTSAEKFKLWFATTKKTNNISSASRNIELYKRAMQYAVQTGKIKTFDLIHYQPIRDVVKSPVVLTEDEFKKILFTQFESKTIAEIKDLYLFQCATGLAYCDIWNWRLKKTDAGNFIIGNRTKSDQLFFVPLDEVASAIFEKYEGKLPIYTNQHYNRVLKLIAQTVGINKKITTHSGRKTFATFMDQQGWSIESIARMLGHSSVKTTETYYIKPTSNRVELEFIQRQAALK